MPCFEYFQKYLENLKIPGISKQELVDLSNSKFLNHSEF